MTLDKTSWDDGVGAHSQTDSVSGDEDQFVISRVVPTSVTYETAVTSGDGTTNFYAAGDQVGAATTDTTDPTVLQCDRVSVYDPEGVLDPDHMELWIPFPSAPPTPPTMPGDHATLVNDSSWNPLLTFVVPAGGYDTVPMAGGAKLHSKAFPHSVAIIPGITEMAVRTNAITASGYTTGLGPQVLLTGASGALPT